MKRALVVLSMLFLGCADPPPDDTAGLSTNDLSLQILVETNEEATTARIGIYALGHDRYHRLWLGGGDRLVARVGDRTFEAEEVDGSLAGYTVKVPITDGSFELDLLRTGSSSARATRIDLPPAFALSPPAGDGLVHLERPFTLQWTPAVASSSMRATLAGPCVVAAERTLSADTGTFTWSVADFGHGATPAPCTVTIALHRPGGQVTLAPELAGVQLFRAQQVRAIGLWATRS